MLRTHSSCAGASCLPEIQSYGAGRKDVCFGREFRRHPDESAESCLVRAVGRQQSIILKQAGIIGKTETGVPKMQVTLPKDLSSKQEFLQELRSRYDFPADFEFKNSKTLPNMFTTYRKKRSLQKRPRNGMQEQPAGETLCGTSGDWPNYATDGLSFNTSV